MVAKKVNLRLGKLAFGGVDVEAMGSKDREDSVQMAEMFCAGAAENEHVV
jgi:hypothetical protein